MQPIKQKKERAVKVFKNLKETFAEYEKSEDESKNIAFKKTLRIIQNTSAKLKEKLSDKEYIQKITEISNKVKDKLETLETPELGAFIDKDLNWMNEIKFIILVDIDDTVRDASQRMGIRDEIMKIHEQRKEVEKDSEIYHSMINRVDKLWDDFFVQGYNDEPKKDVIEMVNQFYEMGFEVKYRTGATAKYRKETEDYLVKNGAKFHELRMRKEGVKIPAPILKAAWIPKYDGAENVFATYDDQAPVNERYRSKGVVDTILVGKDFDVDKHLKEFEQKIKEALVFIEKEEPIQAKKRKKKIKNN